MILDLSELRDRLHTALPQLTLTMVQLEHAESRDRHPALSIEMSERKKDHVYRMTVMIIGDVVNFFVHIHGTSKDLTTDGTQCFTKACAGIDEVFAIVHGCWTGGLPS